MQSTKAKIVDAAIATFIRYGARKTAMTDIADAAGVSRQTLYDQFGNKNELIEAAISRNTDLVLGRIKQRLADAQTLADQLDIYLTETVVRTFERLQTSEDVEDLISGHNERGRAAITVSHGRHREAVVKLLSPHQCQISQTGQSVTQLAGFLVRTAMGLKHCESRRELNNMLASLKTAVLLAASPELAKPK
ncbi:MAG: helix-turn-helix transcriptional regulator [Gammaproteobacteria bacterium]|nr:helix-turn-helix transcriptional regulator [Gammaproteobacteria bacterium]MYH16974.1 helix-turn-helix transcriptional regulator [Gammaproteobacteria bacterium]MYK81709.1 helix-turn-helix transcriptional regulator [Gammaproteobacteria bacterium]